MTADPGGRPMLTKMSLRSFHRPHPLLVGISAAALMFTMLGAASISQAADAPGTTVADPCLPSGTEQSPLPSASDATGSAVASATPAPTSSPSAVSATTPTPTASPKAASIAPLSDATVAGDATSTATPSPSGTTTPASPSATPSASPSASPSATASASPTPSASPSATTSAGPTSLCPATPQQVRTTAGDTAITLEWQAPIAASAQPTHYLVTVQPGNRVVRFTAPVTKVVVDQLRNGVRYGFTVTAVNAVGSSAPTPAVEATPTANLDGEVERMIVAYEPGVKITEAPGVATGSSAVDGVELTPGAALGTGMRTVTLSESVDEGKAEQIAAELTADPRIKWAEPDYFIPLLVDSGSTDLPSKAGAPGVQANASQGGTKTGAVSGQAVSAQNACAYSTPTQPILRCFDDDDWDAGASVDAEIIWSDAYVTAAAPGTLVVDAVPWAMITDNSWLLYSDTDLRACMDTDGDGASNICIQPQWAALGSNQSTGVSIYDRSGGTWVRRSATCSGTFTRRLGDHPSISGTNNSWWQLSINWSCLFGSTAASVRVQSYLRDWLVPAGDNSPDAHSDTPMNLSGTPLTAPGVPSGVGVTPVNAGLSVRWSAPSSDGGSVITGYTARAYAAATGGTALANCSTTSASATPLTCDITGLTPGSTVWVDVTASNAVGASPATTPRTSGIPAAAVAPTAPRNVWASPTSSGLAVTWTAPASTGGQPITGYTARAYAAATGGTAVASCATTSAGCTITGLTNGTPYWVDVTAANSVGSSSASDPRASGTPATTFVPNDPYYASASLWGLNGTYGVKAPDAWAVTRGAPSVVVAVLDTGSTTHPDLSGQTVTGYDMVTSPSMANDGNGRDPDPSDPGDASGGYNSSWHGTHVAGTINAIANNGVGVVGVAPEVRVQHVRVLGAGGGYTSDIVAGITWASGGSVPGIPANPTPARVINMSLGGYGSCSADWQTAIDAAVARGTVVAVAAGNSNDNAANYSPASCANVITVAATGSDGKRASFSNYGPAVEIAAPGVSIWSTLNTGATSPGSPSYAAYSGTSMATPHVAGVVALMLSRDASLTPAAVATRITTASNTTAFPGGACDSSTTRTCGPGIINAGRLLGGSSGAPATVPGAPTSVAGTGGVGQVAVTWAAPTSNGGSAITGYTARAYSALTAGTLLGSCTTATTGCTVTGLTNGSTVYLDVIATNGVGNSAASAPRASASTATPPGSPTAVNATAGPGSASVTWAAPASTGGSAITGYTARAFIAATGGTPIATCTAASPGCTITGLTNGTRVFIDVTASNGIGTGAPSTPRIAVTPVNVPASPTAVTAAVGDTRVVVTWRAPANTGGSAITGYTARAFDSATGGTQLASCTGTTTSCAITGLTNGVPVWIDVVATNAVGTGAPSAPRLTATPQRVPSEPLTVTVTPGSGTLAVTWAVPASDGGNPITGYTARAWSAITGGTQLRTCTSTSTTCTITGLTNGVPAYVDVVATNAAGTGLPGTPRVAGTPRTVPGAPRIGAAIPANGQISVTSLAPTSTGGSPITGYTARAWSTPTGGTLLQSCTTTTTQCTITGLTNGVMVYLDSVATNVAGSGAPSAPRVSAMPRTVPDAPTNVRLVVGSGRLGVSWTAPAFNGGSAVLAYTARAFDSATGGAVLQSCTTSLRSCTINGLTNGRMVYVEVTATNIAGAGAASTPRVAGTAYSVPTSPRNVLSMAGDGTATITWATPASDGGNPITGYITTAWSAPAGGAPRASCTSTTTTCDIGGLVNGTTVYVSVIATNNAGSSTASTPRVATTPRTVPATPTITAVNPGSGQVGVRWSAPNSGGSAITGYRVQVWDAPTGGTALGSCSTAALTCVITGLTNGQAVYLEIAATNVAGTGAPSTPRRMTTAFTQAAAPRVVSVVPGRGQLTVTWSPSSTDGGSPITSYQARAWSAVGGGSVVRSCTTGPGATSCVISGMPLASRYFVDVTAANAAGTSAPTGPRTSATTLR